jgi:toxin ParE1/3/4
MKRYAVSLTEQALLDLDDIAHYIALHDAPEKADHIARQIEQAFSSLEVLPNRGVHPRELLGLGNRTFREIRFKPYRIVYRVYERKVVVFLIADGRRDMRSLLARRLLGA